MISVEMSSSLGLIWRIAFQNWSRLLGRRSRADEQLIVLKMQIIELKSLLIGDL
ncbi:MAG: hypothetical protein WKF84_26890 [Pyrinomonadaceae bacterium]